jgi:uncharacterized OB-fold protein
MMDMMANPPSFLPNLNEADTGPFWAATAEHKLTYQVCRECSGVVFYPRAHCTHCTSTDLEWKESAGKGTLYTYSVVRDNRLPGFAELVPYVVAYVDLDEGFRMLTRIVEVDVDDVKIGSRLTVHWDDKEGLSLPEFELAS